MPCLPAHHWDDGISFWDDGSSTWDACLPDIQASLEIFEIEKDGFVSTGEIAVTGDVSSIENTSDSSAINLDVLTSGDLFVVEPTTKDISSIELDLIATGNLSVDEPPTKDIFSGSSESFVTINFVETEEYGPDEFSSNGVGLVEVDVDAIESTKDSLNIQSDVIIQVSWSISEQNIKDSFTSDTSVAIQSIDFSLNEIEEDGFALNADVLQSVDFAHTETTFDQFNAAGYVQQAGIPYDLYTSNVTLTTARFNWSEPG
jgi:hypothetical protein